MAGEHIEVKDLVVTHMAVWYIEVKYVVVRHMGSEVY